MKRLKNNLLPILFFFLAMSCSKKDTRLLQLTEIDNMMETSPQVAYDSLCHIEKALLSSQGRSVCMKFRLLKAKAQNKLFLTMPSDSIFQDVVSFYDKKGNNNEKMESHYLMGCIYRDQKEAPQAMKCFQDAVEAADTLSKDCDYITLFSIYGQMADIFARQHLIDEAIAATKLYSKYARKANDTYNYIRGKEFLIPYYYKKGDTAAAISQTKQCVDLYEKNGLHKAAVGTLPTLIKVLIERKQYRQAGLYLKKLERESGLFDEEYNIVFDRQAVYGLFGLYYLGVGKVDSAEHSFRKLAAAGFDYDANSGLLAVYKKKGNVDSIVKYAILSEETIDKILQRSTTDAVKQSAALYNYSRLERESVSNEMKFKNEKIKFWRLCLIVLFFIFFVYYWYRKVQRRKKKELAELNENYLNVQRNYRQLKRDIKLISEDKDAVIEEKKLKIEELEKVVYDYRNQYANMDARQKISLWLNSDVIVRFKEMANPKRGQKTPAKDDWNDLSTVMEQCLPILYDKIFNSMSLGNQEQYVCMLLSAGISNSEMAILLNTSAQRITNIKTKANEKLFGVKNATSLRRSLLEMAKV